MIRPAEPWTVTDTAGPRTYCSCRRGPEPTGQAGPSCSRDTPLPPLPTWPTFGSAGPVGGRRKGGSRSSGT
eukprot:8355953-Alexandrium_andersonii.AAC.1